MCVDATSDTEAVLGSPMKLTCISCMKREEISAQTKVNWYYRPDQDAVRQEVSSSCIFIANPVSQKKKTFACDLSAAPSICKISKYLVKYYEIKMAQMNHVNLIT